MRLLVVVVVVADRRVIVADRSIGQSRSAVVCEMRDGDREAAKLIDALVEAAALPADKSGVELHTA